MKYVLVIVDNLDNSHKPIIIDDIAIEYIEVGQTVHGKHYQGTRPTHVVDRSITTKWYGHVKDMTKQAEWIE